MEILKRFGSTVIYKDDAPSLIETVMNALRNGANLKGASLDGATLDGATLVGADLVGASLDGATLDEANLKGANLKGANLVGASLDGATLVGANLKGANLYRATLVGADLVGATLVGATLVGADLKGANLKGANLPNVRICPEVGSFVAWKKTTGGIIQVMIPADADRTSSLVGRKCRASHVVVLNTYGLTDCISIFDNTYVYREGETVRCEEPFSDDIRVECASGIHFFMTKREAEEY